MALLGAVQGVAEVVPVSSSAHLVLVPYLLDWPPAVDRTLLAAGLHAGSCVGVGLALLRSPPDLRTAVLAAGTSVPAAVAGLLAADAVEERLGTVPQLAALLAAAGLALAAADLSPQVRGVGPREAAVAGLAQVAALAPGVSRSGAALTALRTCGVRRADAARFSLLMSVPVTAGAAGLSLLRADDAALRSLAAPLLAGAPVAAGTAWAVTRVAARGAARPLAPWALYRLLLSAGVVRTSRRRDRSPGKDRAP